MHTSIKLCCVAVVCSVAGVAQAQLLAQSAFDTNDDGWRSVSLGGSFVNPPDLSAPPSAPEYFPTGGNPGGHVCDEDVDTRYTYALAPAAFLGNKSGALGGTLTFDMAVMNGDPEPLGSSA